MQLYNISKRKLFLSPMTSNFKVPNEYKDFVSSTDDLFHQIYGNENDDSDSADVIHFSIFFDDGPKSGNAMLSRAIERKIELESILLPEIENLLWHCEVEKLAIIITSKEKQLYFQGSVRNVVTIEDEWTLASILLNLSRAQNNISISITDNDGQFLLIEAADYLPDWLGPDSSCNRVWLRYGQVKIVPYDEPGRQREGGIDLSAALDYLRKTAISSQDSGPDSSWIKKMNKHIRSRTVDVFPAKAVIQEHVCACILPKVIGDLLQQNPELISVAVAAFCAYNNSERFQQAKKRAGPSSSSSSSSSSDNKSPSQHATLPHLLDSALLDVESLTVAPVRFTRALYAKLMFQKFRPPRKFHSLMRVVSSSGSKKVISAFELGCKLCIGLEQAAIHELTVSIPAVEAIQSTDEHWKRLLLSARTYGFNLSDETTVKMLSEMFEERSIIFSPSIEGFESSEAVSALFELTYGQPKEILNGVKISPIISSRLHSQQTTRAEHFDDNEQSTFLRDKIFAPFLKKTVRNDSDAWLYMTPEELDEEMNKRMQTEAGVASAPEVVSEGGESIGREKGTSSGDDEAKQMQDIIDGIKTFMAGKSDYDGVQVKKASAEKKQQKQTKTKMGEAVQGSASTATVAMETSSSLADDNPSDFSNLNFDYISSMLQNPLQLENHGQDKARNDNEEDDENDEDDEDDGDDSEDSDDYSEYNSIDESGDIATTGLGHFTIPRWRLGKAKSVEEDAEEENPSEEADSDDEVVVGKVDDCGGSAKADKGRSRSAFTIADYQTMMDEELQSDSNLLDLFESLTPDDRNPNSDSDINYHLLKNLLESQANSVGYPGGPVHQLLAQMGIQIPKPPPNKQQKQFE